MPDGTLMKRRSGEPYQRPVGHPTPCGTCPKQSPEKAKQLELTDANITTWLLFKRLRATGWQLLTEDMKADRLFQKNMAICEEIYAEFERRENAAAIIDELQRRLGTREAKPSDELADLIKSRRK